MAPTTKHARLKTTCKAEQYGYFTHACICSWCCQRKHVEFVRATVAEPDEVTTPYNVDLTVAVRVEREVRR